jgi:hypothetical protein
MPLFLKLSNGTFRRGWELLILINERTINIKKY